MAGFSRNAGAARLRQARHRRLSAARIPERNVTRTAAMPKALTQTLTQTLRAAPETASQTIANP